MKLRHFLLTAFFCLFVLFLYGPTLTIILLSFQGPDGGLTFPMNGVSGHWFGSLFEAQRVGDLGSAFRRSLALAAMVMIATVLVALPAGLAFRRRFVGSGALLTLTIASLIVPSILVSLGVGILFGARTIRVATHLDVDRAQCVTAAQIFKRVAGVEVLLAH